MSELPDDAFDDDEDEYETGREKHPKPDDEFDDYEEEKPKRRGFFGSRNTKGKVEKTAEDDGIEDGNSYTEKDDDGIPTPVVNITPFEWARPVIGKAIDGSINKMVFKTFFVWFILLSVVGGTFGAAWFIDYTEKGRVARRLDAQNTTVKKFADIANSLAEYEEYVSVINTPSMHAQFSGIAFLASRNGFLVEKTVFSSTPLSHVGENSFLLETGRKLQNVKILGSWAVTGVLSPRSEVPLDDSWAMNFGRQATVLFSKLGAAGAHTTLSSRPKSDGGSATVSVTLWK